MTWSHYISFQKAGGKVCIFEYMLSKGIRSGSVLPLIGLMITRHSKALSRARP